MDKLDDIPIEDHNLPDSELELGNKEETIFEHSLKGVPEGMILETFASLLGYCTFSVDLDMLTKDLPKAKDWGFTHERAMSEMENWGLEMGLPTVPRVSEDLLARIIGSGRVGQMQRYERRGKSYGANRLPSYRQREDDGELDHKERGDFRFREMSRFGDGSRSRRGGGRDGFEHSGGRGRGGPSRSAGDSRPRPSWESRGGRKY